MKKQFLSIIMLVSAISLRGMESEYEQKMLASTEQALAALSRAEVRQDPLLKGLTEEQIKQACQTAGTWAVVGMTENGASVPREDKDYDKYLRDALKIARGTGKTQGTVGSNWCGTCGTKE
jgi:hypothetical protein